jgi:hypothetical protein
MNVHHDDSPWLRQALQAALAQAEPREVPAFGGMWHAAQRPRAAASSWRLDLVAAALTVTAVAVAVFNLPGRTPEPDADYLLAARLTAHFDRVSPTDGWLDQMPSPPLSGGPALPSVEYPLLPKEKFL